MTEANSAGEFSKPGRQRKLDAPQRAAYCALLRLGCTYQAAADVVGVSRETVRRAIIRDAEFADQVSQAIGSRQMALLNRIEHASNKHWQAACWLLERGWPHDFVRRDPYVVTEQEVARLVKMVTDVVLAEVPDAPTRKRITERVGEACKMLKQATIERARRPRVRPVNLDGRATTVRVRR